MRIAIIDLGTNSVRFDIYQINGRGKTHVRLYREKIMVRLGQEIFTTGSLNPSATRRTLNAFVKFSKIARHFNVEKTVAFATSALREAQKPEKLLTPILKRTGINLQIISGKREAELIARGITKNIKVPRGTLGLIDIGGGSTEISILRNKKVIFSDSFPVGTARIQQQHLTKIPPLPNSVLAARDSIQKTINSVFKKNTIDPKNIPIAFKFIGSSGTVKALDKMLRNRIHKKNFSKKNLDKLVSELAPLNYRELLKVPCMEPKRVDQIVSGSIILQEFMQAFGGKEISFSEYCLRDGIFDEEISQVHSKISKTQFEANFDEILQRALRWSKSEKALLKSLQITELFFNSTQSLHKLESPFLNYLKTAMLFRNTGEMISIQNHGLHSSYVVANSHLPYFSNEEISTIALLCKHHEAKKNSLQDLRKEILSNSQKKLAMIGLLQAIDYLDEHQIPYFNIRKNKGKFYFSSRQVESFQFEQACILLNKIFKQKFIIE